jgi:outer membrane biosynthesis protein TonB
MTVQLTARPTAGHAVARPTRTAAGIRGRALLVALGLALASAVLPAAAAHAAPQSPGIDNQLTNPGGNPQPPEPPDPPQWGGPEDVANPTEDPEPPLPPDPPGNGPDDLANPTESPDPTPPPPSDPVDGDSIPTPERVDAGLGGAAAGSHQVAGLALIAAALVLALLVIVIARRHHAEARGTR